MSFRFLHDTATADVAFEATGKTLSELFESSCLATTEAMVDLKSVKPSVEKGFSKSNAHLDRLLYDVLDELVFLKDADNLLFSKFTVTVKEGKQNKATVIAKGEKINQKTMSLHNDVKAITLHLFVLKKTKEGYSATVLLDV